MLRKIRAISLICFAALTISIVFAGCSKTVKVEVQNPIELQEPVAVELQEPVAVELQEPVLFPTESVVDQGVNAASMLVHIPPNAAITKIYATITEGTDPFNTGSILIQTELSGTRLFLDRLIKDPAVAVGKYETTLVQPLCVGPEGAVAQITALDTNTPVNAAVLTLTIVYCPDYCVTD